MTHALGATALIAALACGVAVRHYGWPLIQDLREQRDFRNAARALRHAARVFAYEIVPGTADVVMLGDSITDEGNWPDLLKGSDLINRGIWGDTSDGVLARLPEVIRRRPRLVFLMIGVNDLARDGLAPEQVGQNIRAIVRSLRDNRVGVVLQSVLFMSRGSEANPLIERLNVLLRNVAADEAISFLDLNATLAPAGALLPEVTYDGLHLSTRGYVLWAEALRPFLLQPHAS
jgi:lysophospholipase L1-like esterase